MAVSHSMQNTRWSLIKRIGDAQSVVRRDALSELLEIYRLPMIHFLIAKGCDRDESEDVAHDFIKSKMLSDKFFEKIDSTQGRFRSYLCASLQNYLIDKWRIKSRRREEFGYEDVSERPDCLSPASVFDREWAMQVLRVAYDELVDSCVERKRPDFIVVFNARVWGPHFNGERLIPYSELKEQRAIESVRQAQDSLVNAKRLFKRCLISTVRDTLSDNELLEDELMFLRRVLQSQK